MRTVQRGSRLPLEGGEWEVISCLGEGAFGAVYRAQIDGGAEGAIKMVQKRPGASRELLLAENLSGVDGVVPVIDIGETEDAYLLAMPVAERSLRDEINRSGKFSIENTIVVARDVVGALIAIGKHDVVHRDLKPDNILFLDGKWCLADFGIARYADAVTSIETLKYWRTPEYAAPEQWRHERASAATDIYAFGIIIYEMLVGKVPFAGIDQDDYREQHLRVLPGPLPDDIPPGLTSLVVECLMKSPGARPTAQTVLRRLDKIKTVGSGGVAVLQRADANEVVRRAEADLKKESARNDEERRIELAVGGLQIYDRIVSEVSSVIEGAASNVRKAAPEYQWRKPGDDIVFSLGNAKLSITCLPQESAPSDHGPWTIPFDVVLYGRISLSIPEDHRGFGGKANSLWYCNAVTENEYAWYELGFMHSGLFPEREYAKQPIDFWPGDKAAKALAVAAAEYDVAWPLTRLDFDNLDGFIDRWVEWFGYAADGKLYKPSRRPEVDVPRIWRR